MLSALRYYLARPGLPGADRAHLERWINQASDPIWNKIASDAAREAALSPYLVEGLYSCFIGAALRARAQAGNLISVTASKKEFLARRQMKGDQTLSLALRIDELLIQYDAFQDRLRSDTPPDPPGSKASISDSELEDK